HSLGVSVLAGDSLEMQRDYDFSSTVFGEDLENPAAVGRRAGERAVRRLRPRKPRTARLPVVFDPRISPGLLRSLAGAISGAALTALRWRRSCDAAPGDHRGWCADDLAAGSSKCAAARAGTHRSRRARSFGAARAQLLKSLAGRRLTLTRGPDR